MRFLFFLAVIGLFFSCKSQKKQPPNILWIVTEDISPTLSFYGDNTAKTPNLDLLANESLIYDNAFTVVGACSPSRSSIITGMYPTSIGTMHLRTGLDIMSWGKRKYKKQKEYGINDINNNSIPQYSAVIPEYVKCFTEYLRNVEYFCTNNSKTDYQFAAPVTAWDENNNKAHWRNRPKNKPFFSVFNIGTTHESQLWKKSNLPLTVNPKDVEVPPYLPDNNATRKTIARHYSNVELMDAEVGTFIKQLKEDGLYDNTIIFFYSDHGGPLPRQKREIYDSGLKVPFIVKDLKGTKGRTDRMISFVDLAPTILSLADIKPPEHMEGKAFLGAYTSKARDYIFGSTDRCDEDTDRIRVVRNKQFLYVKNDYPELPKYKDASYRKQIPMMPVFLELQKEGKLNKVQEIWFKNKTNEELYDCTVDPHNINNLALNPKYKNVLNTMRELFSKHINNRPDLGKIPEAELINTMWPNFEQPLTIDVIVNKKDSKMILTSETKGASIAYFISDNPNENLNFDSNWKLYTKPLQIKKGSFIYAMAQRIGYKESVITKTSI